MIKRIIIATLVIGANIAHADTISNYTSSTELVKTKYGSVAIKSKEEFGERKLYLNGKNVNIAQNDDGDFYLISIMSKIEQQNNIVFLIWGGSGGTMDGNTNIHCKFLTILPNKTYKISKLTYCPKDDAVKSNSGVITYSFINPLPYALDSDIGTLNFENNKITITKNIHDEKYYKSYYSHYTPEQIYKMLAKDNDGDPSDMINSIQKDRSWCHACGYYGARYCEPFNWIKSPVNDKYYKQLKSICSKPIYTNY